MGQQGINKEQLRWGIILGIITFAFIAGAYFKGVQQGEKTERNRDTVATLEGQDISINIQTNCNDTEQGISEVDGKKVNKYCVQFTEGDTAFFVLKRLSEQDSTFSFSYDESQYGVFITSVNNYHPDIRSKFWGFYVNDEMSQVGVGEYKVNEGDKLEFKVDEVKF